MFYSEIISLPKVHSSRIIQPTTGCWLRQQLKRWPRIRMSAPLNFAYLSHFIAMKKHSWVWASTSITFQWLDPQQNGAQFWNPYCYSFPNMSVAFLCDDPSQSYLTFSVFKIVKTGWEIFTYGHKILNNSRTEEATEGLGTVLASRMVQLSKHVFSFLYLHALSSYQPTKFSPIF